MEFRNVGKSGLRVSAVGLGCNNFGSRLDLEASRTVIDRALDLGVTLLDTADLYPGSEEVIGQILGERRKNIVLASKFGGPMGKGELMKGASRRYIATAVEASLKRLRTDWIDLYQLHMPDPLTPLEETLRALDDLIRQGKVRYIGCTNLPPWQLVDADWIARTQGLNGFVAIQAEYSLVERAPEKELRPAIEAHGIAFLPYFPLASGLLTGKYKQGQPMPEGARLTGAKGISYLEKYLADDMWVVVQRLSDFAAGRGHSLLELAFAWLLAQTPVCSVIAGATKPGQIEANVAAAGWALTQADLAEIDKITR